MSLTHERLIHLLDYSPESGVFVWRVSPRASVKVGAVAGWEMQGYTFIMIDRKTYGANRLAWFYMTGTMPPADMEVDHRNRIRNDNAWSNLRLLTQQDNKKNKGIAKNNTSGVSGVYWNGRAKRWYAQIGGGKTKKRLGCYKTLEEAVTIRKNAGLMYFAIAEV
jgi:hypothetical protein